MTLSVAMPVTGTSRAPLIFPASISRFSLSKPLAAKSSELKRGATPLRLLIYHGILFTCSDNALSSLSHGSGSDVLDRFPIGQSVDDGLELCRNPFAGIFALRFRLSALYLQLTVLRLAHVRLNA